MDEELAALARAGAATLVAAMATDLWQGTRDAVAGLFRRGGRRRRAAVVAQLENNAALVGAAEAPDEVRRALLGFWSTELRELLRADPASRARLARLVERTGARPEPRADAAGRAWLHQRLEQRNSVSGEGRLYAVQGGDQPHHHAPPAPDRE